uniref:Uncharacterized protein n=2 Tax=Chrysotila carterae TaxID=13221 RepID=A0A7S4BYX3_CHRCT
MLVTRTSQNTFVSASASQGINLLTMNRDDLYLGELLHFLSRFWEMVKRGQPPSEAMHWAEPERFAAFLDQTALLGSGVSKGAHIARPWRRAARGVAASLFLDS